MAYQAKYLKPGRLEDVLLLIQFLASDDRAQIYNNTIRQELGVDPATVGSTSWDAVASEHPEFFRVSGETDNKAIALLAKYATRKSEKQHSPHELLSGLIQVAMQLHERQFKMDERRQALLPLFVALIAGVFTLLATMLPRWMGH